MQYLLLLRLYVINLSVIIVHFMDSAYWREWEMINLPGPQLYLALVFPFVFVWVYGLPLLTLGRRGGLWISLLLGLSGLFGFLFHIYFWVMGDERFTLTLSILLVGFFTVLSLAQTFLTLKYLMAGRGVRA